MVETQVLTAIPHRQTGRLHLYGGPETCMALTLAQEHLLQQLAKVPLPSPYSPTNLLIMRIALQGLNFNVLP